MIVFYVDVGADWYKQYLTSCIIRKPPPCYVGPYIVSLYFESKPTIISVLLFCGSNLIHLLCLQLFVLTAIRGTKQKT